jgi:TatD DNase family protein
MLIDSHCHLDYLTSARGGMLLSDILESASAAGVERMLSVAVDRDNLPRVLEHAHSDPRIHAAVGMHPMSCADTLLTELELLQLARDERVVAIGETGLDYHSSTEHAERQRESFITHLRAASRAGLPVIVHTRDAREDTLRLLAEHGDRRHAGVMHCFTESLEMAMMAIDMNFMISFSGIITFRTADELREVVRHVPLDRMLVETDSPYLAPVPYRGRTNEPRHVLQVAEAVAAIKQVSLQEVAAVTTANFYRLFPRALSVAAA